MTEKAVTNNWPTKQHNIRQIKCSTMFPTDAAHNSFCTTYFFMFSRDLRRAFLVLRRWEIGVKLRCDPSVSCNSCLQHQSMWSPLSHITSLPLSANGSAIQFHTSALRGEATLTQEWGSMLQQRLAFVWRGRREVAVVRRRSGGGGHAEELDKKILIRVWRRWRAKKKRSHGLYDFYQVSFWRGHQTLQAEHKSRTHRGQTGGQTASPNFVNNISVCPVTAVASLLLGQRAADNDLRVLLWEQMYSIGWQRTPRSFQYHTLILHSHCDTNREGPCISSFTKPRDSWIWYSMTGY